MTDLTVTNILEAEVTRRNALLADAVSAMKPVIELLLELRDANFVVALQLDPPRSMTADRIEGYLECPQIHSTPVQEDKFRYRAVVQVWENGAACVTLDTDDGADYEDPIWSNSYTPGSLSQAILDTAVQQRLSQQQDGGSFRL